MSGASEILPKPPRAAQRDADTPGGALLQRVRGLDLQIKFAVASLVPLVVLGFVLARAMDSGVRERVVSSAHSQSELLFSAALRDKLKGVRIDRRFPRDSRAALDKLVESQSPSAALAALRVYDKGGQRVYTSAKSAGPAQLPRAALRGLSRGEIPSLIRAQSRVVSTYLPFTAQGDGPKATVEVALRYEPIRALATGAAAKTRRLLIGGLVLLYGILLLLVGGTSRALQRHAASRERLSLHDSLTGLPNRALFRELVSRAIVGGRRKRGLVAVMLMDLDRFKEVNDTLGHFNGDQLLERIGTRLRGAVRGGDAVARLGGDEFAVVLTEAKDREAVVQAAQRILKVFEEPFVVGGLALEVQASIGIALCPENGKRVSELIQAADVAMYVAKKAHSGFEFYSEDQHQYSPDRLELIGELRRAIEEDELVLFYQPKVDLATNTVKGVEALVRWDHPRRGLLPPDEFVPLAERTSLIKRFTLHLLEQALRQCRTWHDEGLELTVAVNLSMQNLLDLHLPDDVLRLLREYELDPKWLELEVTESVIMSEPRRARAVLNRLAEMGISLAIDDFGTGYSSLAYLKQLPVTSMKIDKSFVLAMDKDPDDDAIVRSTIDLGRNLGLSVIAEGIESQRVFNRLAELGCEHGQGFFMSKALPSDKLMRWVGAYHDFVSPAARQVAAVGGRPVLVAPLKDSGA